jgi:hypothetical protein
MSKMNLLVDLRGYEGNNANTSRSLFNKNLQHVGINIDREITQEVEVPANTVKMLFSASNTEGTVPVNGPVFDHVSIVLSSSQDLQYVEIDKKIISNSLILSNGKALGFRGEDYEISIIGNKTRITWINEWAIGGNQPVETDETIFLWYSYYPSQQDDSNNGSQDDYPGINLFKFLYIEADKECEVVINGTIRNKIKSVVVNNAPKKGVFLISANINDVYVVNSNNSSLILYFITSK